LIAVYRLVQPVLDLISGAKEIPRVGTAGVGLKDLPIDLLSPTKVAGLVVLLAQ
jgi:hypothetical protein